MTETHRSTDAIHSLTRISRFPHFTDEMGSERLSGLPEATQPGSGRADLKPGQGAFSTGLLGP